MVIKELLTQWGFDVDQKPINDADKAVASLKSSIKVLGVATIAAAGTLWGMVKSTADAGDKAFKLSQSLGVSTEALQEFTYAAILSDLSQQELAMGFVFLNRTASEAASGVKTYTDAYGALGVQVKDSNGQIKSSEQLMMEVADAFKRMPDGAKKTATAMEIFGRSGAKMIPLLNSGASGLEALRQEARDTGYVIGREAAMQAEEFNDAITRVELTFIGLRNTIGVQFLPLLKEMIDKFREWVVENRVLIREGLHTFVRGSIWLIKNLLNVLYRGINIVKNLSVAFGGLGKMLKVVAVIFTTIFLAQFMRGLGLLAIAFGVKLLAAIMTFVSGLKMVTLALTIYGVGVRGIAEAWKASGAAALFAQAKMLLTPILVGAAIVALVLLIEDLVVAFQGGKSVIGGFFDWLQMKFDALPGYWKAIIGGIVGVLGWPVRVLMGIVGQVAMAIEAATQLASGNFRIAWEVLKDMGKEAAKLITPIPGAIQVATGQATIAEGFGLAGLGRGGTNQNVQVTNNVTVPEGTPPGLVQEGIRQGVADGLDRALFNAGEATIPAGVY